MLYLGENEPAHVSALPARGTQHPYGCSIGLAFAFGPERVFRVHPP
jgi:hypothetical protein